MLFISASAFAQDRKPDPKFYIFLCFGRSNMEAGARPEEQDKGPVDQRFQMLAAVDMPRLNRKMGQSPGIVDAFGHELTFPSAFRQSRGFRPKGIVKIGGLP